MNSSAILWNPHLSRALMNGKNDVSHLCPYRHKGAEETIFSRIFYPWRRSIRWQQHGQLKKKSRRQTRCSPCILGSSLAFPPFPFISVHSHRRLLFSHVSPKILLKWFFDQLRKSNSLMWKPMIISEKCHIVGGLYLKIHNLKCRPTNQFRW